MVGLGSYTRGIRAVMVGAVLAAVPGVAQVFQLPTANRALFEPGGEERFLVGTVGRSWTSGCFGCVRSDGWQMHEGLDIRCLQRDKQGEPIDPVMATTDGSVAYVNSRPSLSNYGNYIVLKHEIDGVEVFSLYAHLRAIAPGIRAGQPVKAGQVIGTMGRTANTRETISKDRAHVHFEVNLLVNDDFGAWFNKTSPGQRNDHGKWNGQNLLGLDPKLLLLQSKAQGERFNMVEFIRSQTEMCRVVVRDTRFPWLQRYSALVESNAVARAEGVAGYELVLNYNGIPFRLIPRAASELKSTSRYHLLSVNEPEYRNNPCRRLITHRGTRWELTPRGISLLDLLTY